MGNSNTRERDDDAEAKQQLMGVSSADSRNVEIFHSLDSEDSEEAKPNLCRRIINVIFAESWLFLILVGIVAGLAGFGLDYVVQKLFMGMYIYGWHKILYDQVQVMFVELVQPIWAQWILWTLWACVFAALSALAVILISPHAAGSGIPEMKCILGGVELHRYLNFRTLIAKVTGLIFSFAAGLSIGKEGPYVHISSMICSLLSKLPFFSHIRKNDAAYMQVLAAACAVGVTATFGTPVGGVLFSMEVTSSFYLIDNLWRSFFVSVVGQVVLSVLKSFGRSFMSFISSPKANIDLFDTDWMDSPYTLTELVPFGILGIVSGILGGLFVLGMKLGFRLTRIHEKLQTPVGHILRAVAVAFVIAQVAYPFDLMRNDQHRIISYLAQQGSISNWGELTGLCIAKFILTILSVAFTGVAAGVYAPVFLEGAILGRLYGELVNLIFPSLGITPGSYAIVGAAAFSAGVTRTISTAIIVVELTKQVDLLLPVLISVLIAVAIGRMISLSVYGVMIEQRDLPAMPRFKLFGKSFNKKASDVMVENVRFLSVVSTFGDVAQLLATSDYPSFPLVDEEGIFLGVVRRNQLAYVLDKTGVKWKKKRSLVESIEAHVVDRVKTNWKDQSEVTLKDDKYSILDEESLDTPPVDETKQLLEGKFDILDQGVEAPTQPIGFSESFEVDEAQSPANGLDAHIPFVFNKRQTESDHCVDVDSSVMTISSETPLVKLHFLFTVLGVSHMIVTSRGRLSGILTRRQLIKTVNSIALAK